MRGLVLAAGLGSRLRPYTDDRPKCMVEYQGQPILHWILSAFEGCGVGPTSIVSGYQAEKLPATIRQWINPDFATTNMVYSLFCAEVEGDEDIVVSYGDIAFSTETIRPLVEDQSEIAILADLDWRALWERRMSDPMSDAETLKVEADGALREIGKRPRSYSEIEGQYMGLLKFSRTAFERCRLFYDRLDPGVKYEGRAKDQMFMTTFLQLLVDSGTRIQVVRTHAQWIEIDSASDLNISVSLT